MDRTAGQRQARWLHRQRLAGRTRLHVWLEPDERVALEALVRAHDLPINRIIGRLLRRAARGLPPDLPTNTQ